MVGEGVSSEQLEVSSEKLCAERSRSMKSEKWILVPELVEGDEAKTLFAFHLDNPFWAPVWGVGGKTGQ